MASYFFGKSLSQDQKWKNLKKNAQDAFMKRYEIAIKTRETEMAKLTNYFAQDAIQLINEKIKANPFETRFEITVMNILDRPGSNIQRYFLQACGKLNVPDKVPKGVYWPGNTPSLAETKMFLSAFEKKTADMECVYVDIHVFPENEIVVNIPETDVTDVTDIPVDEMVVGNIAVETETSDETDVVVDETVETPDGVVETPDKTDDVPDVPDETDDVPDETV